MHESQWFPDECRCVERPFKKLDLQILEWDDEDEDASIPSDSQEEFEDESDVVIKKTFEVLEMKDFPPMQHPDTEKRVLLVRPCYLKLFDLVMAESQKSINPNITVTGNPGIGKSIFYLYFIWRIIKEGLPSKFSHLVINCGDVYHFYENKEFIDLVSEQERNRFKTSAGVLRLVDGDSDALEGWKGTTVLFASPGTKQFRDFAKARFHSTFVMPIWIREELLICNEVCGIGFSAEQIRDRDIFYGGIPRIIFAQGDEWRSKVEAAIASSDCQDIFNYVKVSTEVHQDDYTHLVLKMVPLDQDFKKATLDFLSEQIGDKVVDKLGPKCLDYLKTFFS